MLNFLNENLDIETGLADFKDDFNAKPTVEALSKL